MAEDGILSIVRRGHTYQVRYASSNPYDMDRPPYPCPDECTLVTWLRHCGIDAWSLQQAVAVLRQGSMAVLPLVLSEEQLQAYFPAQRPPRVGMDMGDAGVQADPGATASAWKSGSRYGPISGVFALPRATIPVRDVGRTRAHAAL